MQRIRPASRRAVIAVLVAVSLGALGLAIAASASAPARPLVAIGSDDQPDTLRLFVREAARHDASGQVVILRTDMAAPVRAITAATGIVLRRLTGRRWVRPSRRRES